MKRISKATTLGIPATILAISSWLWAGGPVSITGPGTFGTWDPAKPVPLIFDNGPLSATITRDQGANLILDIIQAWSDVDSATVSFSNQGFLDVDVTPVNVDTFINNVDPRGSVVVFDSNGDIIADMFGEGSRNTVLGFTLTFYANAIDDYFDGGASVINGLRASSPSFRNTVLHEFGHLLGLDHTQAGLEFFNSFSFNLVPVMFPYIAQGQNNLLLDDIAWISWLYPTPEFAQQTGTIMGSVRRRPGGPFAGANVVLVPVSQANPQGALFTEGTDRISVVSDFLITSDGSFELPGVPPGDYNLFIEPLNSAFVGGSGVGPYDTRFTGFPKDYYNGVDESGDPAIDDPGERSVFTVSAGQMLDSVIMFSNETQGELGSLGDDDEELYPFPTGFRFPFYGKVYDSVVVNSDGDLTFGAGDNPSADRDLPRFLGGPPRVAPLFTDLDPTAGGEITATFEQGHLTFTWNGVPEYSEFGTRPGNTFSVTLFPSGDLLFQYDAVSLLPDPLFEGGVLNAIVGVSPGGGANGTSINLSEQVNPIPFNDGPVFETFVSAGSFDLVPFDLYFDASAGEFQYYFPFLKGDNGTFTGFALTNDADETASLQIEALKSNGDLQDYPTNPSTRFLDSKQQLARLGAEIFDLPLTTPRDGWVRISANTSQVAAFFLFGDGLADPQSELDGSVAFTEQGNPLYFTRVFDGPGTFPTTGPPADAVTRLYLANPNPDAITATFTLVDGDGNPVGDPVERQIAGLGCLSERVNSLFGLAQAVGGFVRVDINGPGAVGFELVELLDTLLGFNASFGNDVETSYSAQLASGSLGAGAAIFSSVKLSNISGADREVTLTATANDGSEIAKAMMTLGANQSLESSAADLFELGVVTETPAIAGSLTVTADGPGIIGDVIFGDPIHLRYAAAIPLQSTLFTRAIFSQVANEANQDPSRQTFTGLAFKNPNAEAVQITVRVFTEDMQLAGEETINLASGARLSTLLADLVAGSAGQARGYIEVTATLPIVAQQLFGNQTLDYLSAVPPTIFQ